MRGARRQILAPGRAQPGPSRPVAVAVARAALLLHTEAASIKDIAARCGFPDADYFAKVFRRSHAISPSDHRGSGAYGQSTPRS